MMTWEYLGLRVTLLSSSVNSNNVVTGSGGDSGVVRVSVFAFCCWEFAALPAGSPEVWEDRSCDCSAVVSYDIACINGYASDDSIVALAYLKEQYSALSYRWCTS